MELWHDDSRGTDLGKRLAATERELLSRGTDVVVLDDEGSVAAGMEADLYDWGVGAEVVPSALGGALLSAETLARRASVVFGYDPSLAMRTTALPICAAFSVWSGGSPEQQRLLAEDLVSGHAVGTAEVHAGHGVDAWSVRRVAGYTGSRVILVRDHSTAQLRLWHDPSKTTPTRRDTQRLVGLRGFSFEDLTFDTEPYGLDLPAGYIATDSMIETVVAAASTGILDAALSLCHHYVRERHLYGNPLIALPHVKHTLAVVEAIRLLCEATCGAATRALHFRPTEAESTSFLTTYALLVATHRGMRELASLFSSTFYARVAPYQLFEKLYRDHRVLASLMLNQATESPLALEALSRSTSADFTPEIFRFNEQLPPLIFGSPGTAPSASLLAPLESERLLDKLNKTDPASAASTVHLRTILDKTRGGLSSRENVSALRHQVGWCAAASARLGAWAAAERPDHPDADVARMRATLSIAESLATRIPPHLGDDLVGMLISEGNQRSPRASVNG